MGKHKNVKRWEKYDEDGDLDGDQCPRCGAILADHDNRKTCGNCGYTQIKK